MRALDLAFGFHLHHVTLTAGRPDLSYRKIPRIAPGYTVRWGTKQDFIPFIGRIPDLDQQFVDEAFARGDECTVAFHGDELVSFGFVSRTWARVTPQLRIDVPAGFRYGYKSWTHPDHRRQSLASARYRLERMRSGFFEERSLGYVETSNYASLLHGYRHPSDRTLWFGYIGWITVFGRQIPFSTRTARWLGVRLTRRSPR